jgi:hypothetical protein
MLTDKSVRRTVSRTLLVQVRSAADARKEGAMNYGQRRKKKPKTVSFRRAMRMLYVFDGKYNIQHHEHAKLLMKVILSGLEAQRWATMDAIERRDNRGLAKKGKSE